MVNKALHEENRLSWNQATAAHNSHKRDQAKFLREGGSTLFPEEIELLGDIAGLSLVHLQCNSGQDSLSLAQRGAVVTGVDISDTAIAFARRLSEESGIPATFRRMDLYDWLEETAKKTQRFDIAFCSYGAICWLSDLDTWAKGIAAVLTPGGRFVLVEFHPFAMTFDDHWTHKFPYFQGGQVQTWEEGIGDYVADSGTALAPSGYLEGVKNFKNPYRSHEFHWGIGEVVTALLEAGLTITALREYPYANGCKQFERMRETPGGRMIPPEDVPSLPLMYGIAARKGGESIARR
ncbi:MAG: methyltransferase domain-containing protein [Deinococcus sp.]|nr:methyltransferase domain-containing protein [Deinococcus sp.]